MWMVGAFMVFNVECYDVEKYNSNGEKYLIVCKRTWVQVLYYFNMCIILRLCLNVINYNVILKV